MKKIFEKIFKGYTVLEEVHSPINGKIQVLEDIFGKKRLVVGGLSQSGEPVEKIWQSAIKQLSNLAIKQCLILGLGAGSAAKLVSRLHPGAKIVGIEIDPEIIRLGKKYFGLGEIKKLKIEIGDAVICLNDLNHFNKDFDLILVDLYIGNKLPEEVKSEKFLKDIKKLLSKEGIAIFNRLYYSDKKETTDKFEQKLRKVFSQIEIHEAPTNLFFLVSK